MNRFSPLILRAPVRSGPARFAAIGALTQSASAASNEDLRLFFTAFVGGLIFFGTLFA
jgi:hypothetical protein